MKKSLIMTTATVAGLGVAATTQTALASEAPTENTVTAAVNDKVTDKDLSDAEKRAVDTAKDADQKAKDTGQAKDTLDEAQKDKDTKKAEKDALEKYLEKAKDATPEKIQKETEDVDAKEKAKTDKDADAKDKADQVTKKSDEAKLAKDELDKARTGVEKADKELKDATDDYDPAAKDKSQKEKDDADKDVLVKDKAKRDAETELEKAKENDKTREAKKVQERQNKADKEADKTAKEGAVKDAEKAVKDAEEKLKTAQYPTDVTVTPEWLAKAKELIKRRMDKYPEPYPNMDGMDADQIDKADEEWNARYTVWLEQYRKDIRRLEEELTELDRDTNEKWMEKIGSISENGIKDGENEGENKKNADGFKSFRIMREHGRYRIKERERCEGGQAYGQKRRKSADNIVLQGSFSVSGAYFITDDDSRGQADTPGNRIHECRVADSRLIGGQVERAEFTH